MQMRIRSTVHNKTTRMANVYKRCHTCLYYNTTPRKVFMRTSNNDYFLMVRHLFLFIYATMVNEPPSISLVVSTRNNNIKPRQNNYTITNEQQHYTNTCLDLATKIRLNDIVMNPDIN